MDKDFQTSFIPKKPMIEKRAQGPQPVNMFTVIALFVFFTMLLATGALYFYKGVLNKQIADMQNSLQLSKSRFEPSKITQLQELDNRLKASTEILSNHITVTPIFQALEDLTMKSVSYTKFSYQAPDDNSSTIHVTMSGVADGYRSIALQSDLFAKNKNIIDPVFSKLNLDDSGDVTFDLDFDVNPDFVNYKEVLAQGTPGTSDTSADTMAPAAPATSAPDTTSSTPSADTTYGTPQTPVTAPTQ